MCGIAGAYFHKGADPVIAVRAMSLRMQKRGPDATGEWTDEAAKLCLGHRRLSIIDLDARSGQPMISSDGRYAIVFNGEIYNYRELRNNLSKEGVTFRTEGDTEVLLELYRRHGVAALELLRGMFAFAIWDTQERSLLLARDPYGIKPLYIAHTSHGPMFASQVKALLETRLISRSLDPAGIAGFYLWGSVPEPFTIYRDIHSVPAGSYIVVDDEGPHTPVRYADIGSAFINEGITPLDLNLTVRDALNDSVRAHLVSDVPVAVLLSGGVDSATIAGLMAEMGKTIEGITLTFDEFSGKHDDEGPNAKAIADYYGFKSTLRRVNRAEFLSDLPAIFDAMDQPSIDGINTWFAAKAVAERGFKVVLSGIGGDEIFAGYDTFKTVPKLYAIGRHMPTHGVLRDIAGGAASFAAKLFNNPKLAGIPTLASDIKGSYLLRRGLLLPSELSLVMGPEAVKEGLASLAADLKPIHPDFGNIGAVAMFESTHYLRNQLLRDSDWASMAHSLELRTPLVDWQLLQKLGPHVGAIAAVGGKRLLSNAAAKPLPAGMATRRKTGFSVPMEAWSDSEGPSNRNLPKAMRTRWARSWACTVAKEFGLMS